MASAIVTALVVGVSALDCSVGGTECPASHPEVEDELSLLSLRSSHRKWVAGQTADDAGDVDDAEPEALSDEAEVVKWGNKTVIAFSSDDGFTEENGWYGDSVAHMDNLKQMAFAPGGTFPQQFFLRPVPGSDASGCIQYGEQVVIAKSKSEDDSGRCGWYGCEVAQVLNDILSFLIGGKDPQSFFFLSPSGKAGCINYGDQVTMAEASTRDSTTNVLYKNTDNVMAWGVQSANDKFFLRPPAIGTGPNHSSFCDNINATMARVIDNVMEKANEKLDNITANATGVDNTTYWWNIDFKGPLFGIRWKNNAGKTIKADLLTNITASGDFTTSDCVTDGSDKSFTTSGSMELLWVEPATGSLELFYQGFIPFIHLDKKISVKMTNLQMKAELAAKLSSPSLTKLCIDSIEASDCQFTADVKVTGAPNFQGQIEAKIEEEMTKAGDQMCEKLNDYGKQLENTCLTI